MDSNNDPTPLSHAVTVDEGHHDYDPTTDFTVDEGE